MTKILTLTIVAGVATVAFTYLYLEWLHQFALIVAPTGVS